jgi:hypothetical protein
MQNGLESHNRNLKSVALFTLIIFAINILVSGLLLFLPQADITYGIGCRPCCARCSCVLTGADAGSTSTAELSRFSSQTCCCSS